MAMADEDQIYGLARVFFGAATKASEDSEDILPQEDGEDVKLSVFYVFAELFPEAVGENGAGAKNKRMRLHFNKIGYSVYGKEQSRRVPSLRAKPGNPGYGFRRARWRDTLENEADRKHCESSFADAGLEDERIQKILARVQEVRHEWDRVRRPSRPAGPGRPRRAEGEGRGNRVEQSQCPGHCDEPNSEPRNGSPGVLGTVMEALTVDREGPSGACYEGRDDRGDARMEHFALLQAASQMHDAGGDAGGQHTAPPSAVSKRSRDNDAMVSPSIYPRLTALKLTSPYNGPVPSPSQFVGFHDLDNRPLQNRSPNCPNTPRAPDRSLLLPPLTLSPCAQPAGGEEESATYDSVKALQVTGRILRGDAACAENEAATLPRARESRDLPRGCQELSALEFLASAAAAQSVASI